MKKIIYNILTAVMLLTALHTGAQNSEPLTTTVGEEEITVIEAPAPDTVCEITDKTPPTAEELPEGYAVADTMTATNLTDSILVGYTDWETVELNGKLRMEGLPLTPSVRIYMVRDSSVSISVRAPFVGEVGRLETNLDSVTAINKMGRTYSSYAVADSPVPVDVSTLQCLLLGRINIPGRGQLNVDTAPLLDIYVAEETDNRLLLPKHDAEIEGCSYGFVTDAGGELDAVIVTVDSTDNDSVTAEYNRNGDATDIDVLAAIGERIYVARLELKAPKWNTEGFAPIAPGVKYRCLSFRDFLKSF
ncbi:MAG: DUF4292 domain-containing protein [Muribaculaceae bacterium]|nr:DUF4292 domain-containing protein [Bacteroides sp.]MDE6843431.1 DUF4292 domain-containing protein [Muribaculaceae bacterium]